jgi:CIC family chloride channel protein
LFIAGAAAGLAATFRTPLTAILFALEIPYKNDLDRETLIEAIISSVPAYLLSVAVLGSESIFGKIPAFTINFYVIGLSLLLGLICGLYSVFFTKSFAWTEQISYTLRRKFGSLGLILIGAAILSICGFISLYTIGVGFNFTNAIIQGTSLSILALVVIVLLKTFLTSVTLHFGGSGGLFFPTIVIGAGIGYIFAHFFDVGYTVIFIAVGMAALLGGTHKILLTPVAFVVETLGGLFAIPALLANAVSYVVSGKYSFYTLQPRTSVKAEELALERFFLKAEKTIPKKLQKTLVSEVMTTKLIVLHQGSTVKEALDTFEGTNLRVLPVIDTFGHVVGVVNLEDMAYGDIKRYSMSISETIIHNPVLIGEQSCLEKVAQLMMEKEEDHIFIVDKEEKLIGVVSGIDVVKKIIELLSS